MMFFTYSETEQYIVDKLKTDYGIDHVPIYRNGALVHISGTPDSDIYENRQIAYSANIIILDDMIYNLEKADSISTIKTPNYYELRGVPSVTSDLSYILNIRAKATKDPKIAKVLIPLAYNLMRLSPIRYTYKDYSRLAIQLYNNGLFAEGDKIKNDIEKLQRDDCAEKVNRILSSAKSLNTDLLQASMHEATCSECSKYQGRVYSISGKSSKYPTIPSSFFKYGGFHEDCRHTFYPFVDGCSLLSVYSKDANKMITVDPVKYSNRPYIDERTEEDIIAYNRWLEISQQEKEYIKNKREENLYRFNSKYRINQCQKLKSRYNSNIFNDQKFCAEVYVLWGVPYRLLAIYHYKKCCDLLKDSDKQFHDYLFLALGYLNEECKKFDEAIEVYAQYIKLNPGNQEAYIHIADCLRKQNALDSAILFLEEIKSTPYYLNKNDYFYKGIDKKLADLYAKREKGYIYKPRNSKVEYLDYSKTIDEICEIHLKEFQ